MNQRPVPTTKSQIPRKEKLAPVVPSTLYDRESKAIYDKGIFMGKGGFAHCYELRNKETGKLFAGKVVPKTLLVKQYQKNKMVQEVQIQRQLSHKNIVKLFSYFEDTANVYIILELCKRRSLMELHKRRKAVTEPEARYFTLQVVEGVMYLHHLKIIHRDLKLGNLFLNDELQVKIGDFGLATTVENDERKKTLCGTPNYIAPEILNKKGHSFEVDIWAIGCILYILLFGHPPFESKSLEETYSRICNNNYTIPSFASAAASGLIHKMLSQQPSSRPTIEQVYHDIFFKSGFLPTRLPVSCLTMVPKFGRDADFMEENVPPQESGGRTPRQMNVRKELASIPINRVYENADREKAQQMAAEATFREPEDAYLSQLYQQISSLFDRRIPVLEENEAVLDCYQSPECLPIFWISKWVDYSDKYGIGYELCDKSVGVLFNDNSRIMIDKAGNELTYIERNNKEHYFNMHNGSVPQSLVKKNTLLTYFRSYMNDHLLNAGEGQPQMAGDDLARLPTLRVWFRTKSSIVFHLSNGTLQINFFTDHVKMMLCPHMQSVTFIDQHKKMMTYKICNFKTNGCPPKFLQRLDYAKGIVERLMSNTHTSRPFDLKCSEGGILRPLPGRSASANTRKPGVETVTSAVSSTNLRMAK